MAQIVTIRPNLEILFRLLIYKPTKITAGIIAVPGSEAIKTIGKNNISSIHLSHWKSLVIIPIPFINIKTVINRK
jgi:hypothetical protein